MPATVLPATYLRLLQAVTLLLLVPFPSGSQPAAEPSASLIRRVRIPLDEGHLSYTVRGGTVRGGRGASLILIPGSFNDSRQWAEVVPALDPSLNLVLVELRGHGQSWPPAADGSIEQFAQDVLRVADHEQRATFYVGGHSIGGMVALEVGNQRPGAVRGIISLEGWTHYRAAQDAFEGRMYTTLSPQQQSRRRAARLRATARWSDEQRQLFAQIWRQWDGSAFLARTRIPILEVYGDRGGPTPTAAQLGIPRRPNIDLRWIRGASHSLPLERPVEVARLINAFIDEVEGSSASR